MRSATCLRRLPGGRRTGQRLRRSCGGTVLRRRHPPLTGIEVRMEQQRCRVPLSRLLPRTATENPRSISRRHLLCRGGAVVRGGRSSALGARPRRSTSSFRRFRSAPDPMTGRRARCALSCPRSQDLRTSGDPTSLDGALLRVDPATGAALPDTAPPSADSNARRIVAHGRGSRARPSHSSRGGSTAGAFQTKGEAGSP